MVLLQFLYEAYPKESLVLSSSVNITLLLAWFSTLTIKGGVYLHYGLIQQGKSAYLQDRFTKARRDCAGAQACGKQTATPSR